jgi:hypothetical protein
MFALEACAELAADALADAGIDKREVDGLVLGHIPESPMFGPGFFFYPRSRCPSCLGVDWTWEEVSGRGHVHSFTVDRVGHVPALRPLAPYAIAIVELDAAPRLTARLVDCDPDAVKVGMPVVTAYEDVEGTTLVHFRPA